MKEVREKTSAREVHLIAKPEAAAAWATMGFRIASEEQIEANWVAYKPRTGEAYMAVSRKELIETEARRRGKASSQAQDRGGRRTIRQDKRE